jgi:hypothetical protein
MEALDPVEALKLIRKLALVAAGSSELGYLKTTIRDVLVINDRALPTLKRDQPLPAVTERNPPANASK